MKTLSSSGLRERRAPTGSASVSQGRRSSGLNRTRPLREIVKEGGLMSGGPRAPGRGLRKLLSERTPAVEPRSWLGSLIRCFGPQNSGSGECRSHRPLGYSCYCGQGERQSPRGQKDQGGVNAKKHFHSALELVSCDSETELPDTFIPNDQKMGLCRSRGAAHPHAGSPPQLTPTGKGQ